MADTDTFTENLAKDRILRELERKARDEILVLNPTEDDFYTVWDGYRYVVPNKSWDKDKIGKGKTHLPRPIAKKYLNEMYIHLLFRAQDEAIAEENAKRVEKGLLPMDKHQEQDTFIYRKGLAHSPEKKKEIISKLYLGLHTEFGRGVTVDSEPLKKRDSIDIEDIMKDLDKVQSGVTEELQDTQIDTTIIEKKKDKLAKEVGQ